MKHSTDPPLKTILPSILCAVFFRLVLNTSRRFAYPFAPVLSRSIGVSLTAITSLIAVNQFTSLLSIFLGPVIDRMGYKRVMIISLFIVSVGMFVVFGFPSYWTVCIALTFAGIGKSLFDPSLHSFIGTNVPYHRRGFAIGISEFSWAGSTLIGIPVIGMVMSHFGWQAPFLLMGLFGCCGMTALYYVLPPDVKQDNIQHPRPVTIFKDLKQVVRHQPVIAIFMYAFFNSMANDCLFVVYGAWLESAFHLSIIALGFTTTILGAAELCGETLTAMFSDKIGLKRSFIIGILLTTSSYLLLPLISTQLNIALSGLFIVFFVFEFSIVVSFSLCTELVPEMRATVLTGYYAFAGLGRMAGTLFGSPIWLKGGIMATALTAAALSTVGLLFVVWGFRKWKK